VKFPDLDGSAFQHPLDREATDNLRMLAGFDRIVAKFSELRYERLLYYFNIANSVRVGPNQFPRLYDMLREGCAVLDVPEPEFYVSQQQQVNAFTFGHNKPFVVMFTRALELMTDDEVMAVVAHELGHIKCGHVLYYSMAAMIRDVLAILGQLTLGMGRLVSAGLEAALMDWRRRSELSADRAALLVMQDPRPVITMLTKLAGGTQRMGEQLDPDEFLKQARAFEDTGDMLDMVYRSLAEFFQGYHPFAVERVKAIDLWAGDQQYKDILAGSYARNPNKKIRIAVQG
jgi:Zn-dependent protease with chaperone function